MNPSDKPNAAPSPPPRLSRVLVDMGHYEMSLSLDEALRLRDRIDAAIREGEQTCPCARGKLAEDKHNATVPDDAPPETERAT